MPSRNAGCDDWGSLGPFLGEKFPDLWNEFREDFHRRVSGFVGRFVLCYGLFVQLDLEVFQDATNTFFVPPFRKLWLLHFLLRRRSALSRFPDRRSVIRCYIRAAANELSDNCIAASRSLHSSRTTQSDNAAWILLVRLRISVDVSE